MKVYKKLTNRLYITSHGLGYRVDSPELAKKLNIALSVVVVATIAITGYLFYS